MNTENRKTAGFKPILVSPETHARLAEITKKSQVFNDVISELLRHTDNGARSKSSSRSPSH